MSKTPLTEPQQRLWNDLMEESEDPYVGHNMENWAEFVQGVTEYDAREGTCTWNGKEVYLDSEAPYVVDPDDRFPATRNGFDSTTHHAWETPDYDAPGTTVKDMLGMAHAASIPPPEMPVDVDDAVRNTTAFQSFDELVDAMRGNDGYGQKYTPTLRPDQHPKYEDGLHAARAEAQRLGFDVFPSDETFDQDKSLDPSTLAVEHEAPTLDEIEFLPQGDDLEL